MYGRGFRIFGVARGAWHIAKSVAVQQLWLTAVGCAGWTSFEGLGFRVYGFKDYGFRV